MVRRGVVWCVAIKEGFVGEQGRLWEIRSSEEEGVDVATRLVASLT